MNHDRRDPNLDILRDKILLLGGATEAAVHRAIESLTGRDSELAQRVLEEDKIIDRMEVEIDEMSIDLLAKLQPEEHDLRFVISVAKITPILERIADHAG
ncbi:MAG TPA: PhoU domain-containing protein, partial [Pyrinomonadaceae bacterium]|nr:PhoU domain-containing protein [Pyrinomonadaceae bacterium]